jgi:type IV secretion system protein VirB5
MTLHKPATYKSMEIDNPMAGQDKVYDDLLQNERSDKKRWRGIAYIFVCFTLLGIAGLFYGISLQRAVPVLVATTEWGEPKYLGSVTQSSFKVPQAALEYEVKDFISKLRTVSSDAYVVYNNIESCYAMVTPDFEEKMTRDLKENSPFDLIGKSERAVQIQSILKLSTGSYQVDWSEVTIGKNAGTVYMRGIFTVTLLVPNERTIQKNPLGIYISNYAITTLQ